MEDFVTFEIAKKLKEKGFPQVTFGNYNMQSACYIEDGRFYENGCITEVSRAYTTPTIAQVLKWLRENKRLEANGCYDNDEEGWMGYVCEMDVPDLYAFHALKERHKLYEQAAVAAIEYILDNNLI